MKKYIALILIAAAALSACTHSELEPQGYTLTIQATKEDLATKALTPDGNTLKATWDGTEEVQVYKKRYNDEVGYDVRTYIGTLSAVASSSNRTALTGTMCEAPDPAKDRLEFYYISALQNYEGQDGTLATIATKFDYCEVVTKSTNETSGDTYSVEGNKIIFDELATLQFKGKLQAIIKFIFQDATTKERIYPVRLIISDSNTRSNILEYYDNITWDYNYGELNLNLPGDTHEIYVALKATNSCRIKLVATDKDGAVYQYEKAEDVGFTPGKYYQITVNMAKVTQ
ncbi:MAG: hypothetical protein J6O51_02295 [Bacteroidales bacterium]|nr:hypothetical protein [Bacteroidales bacterium]